MYSNKELAQTITKDNIFGIPLSREQVLTELRSQFELYQEFLKLSADLQEEFLEFCMGTRGLHITYDPVFKHIFSPMIHPERLEDFLSSCLKQRLKIIRVLPNESYRLTEDGSLLVMDLLVQLESGALVNIEIQRFGYLFPGARCACYSSDLVMRQYSQVREQKRLEHKKFSYKDIQKVYTIVLIQKSTSEFHQLPDSYLHYGRQTFDTGLELDMLQEYLLIPLDIFLKKKDNITSKLDAWLYFIASDKPQDIQNVITAYPEFRALYQEVFQFRFQLKELISMFSEALRILDANTVQYMIEEQQKTIDEQKRTIAENTSIIAELDSAIAEKDSTIAEKDNAIAEKDNAIAEHLAEIQRLKALLKKQE